MKIQAVKTPRIELNFSLEKVLDYLPRIYENSVVAVTSKVVSICEGRYISKDRVTKRELIEQEAEKIFESDAKYDIFLTIKNGILIPSAGVDESNGDNIYVMYPKDAWKSAEHIQHYLKKKNSLKNLGVIITDSHTTIMRRGVTGICLSWCGFHPLYSYINKPDLYDHALRVTQVNIVDALATSAVFCMGEGNESTPMSIIYDIPRIEFTESSPSEDEKYSVFISQDEDLYAPLLKKC